jgi:hypothetical protein
LGKLRQVQFTFEHYHAHYGSFFSFCTYWNVALAIWHIHILSNCIKLELPPLHVYSSWLCPFHCYKLVGLFLTFLVAW